MNSIENNAIMPFWAILLIRHPEYHHKAFASKELAIEYCRKNNIPETAIYELPVEFPTIKNKMAREIGYENVTKDPAERLSAVKSELQHFYNGILSARELVERIDLIVSRDWSQTNF